MRNALTPVLFFVCAAVLPAAKNLEVYFIDVEGGQATLFVSPSGECMLVDTGWPDLNNRDAARIAAAAKAAGVKKIDYLVSHHGTDLSDSPQLAHALDPRVAIVDNGARKGGSPEVWETLRATPGLEDIWQLHYAVGSPRDHNPPDPFIANVDEICQAKWLRLEALKDGSFTVSNSRNRYEKTYAKR